MLSALLCRRMALFIVDASEKAEQQPTWSWFITGPSVPFSR